MKYMKKEQAIYHKLERDRVLAALHTFAYHSPSRSDALLSIITGVKVVKEGFYVSIVV